MSKITLSSVGALSSAVTAATTINNNFSTIQTAVDNTLSRDGTATNTMGANLDMNSNRIVNLPTPISNNEPLRLTDLSSFISGSLVINALPVGGTVGKLLVKNSSTDYDAVWSSTVSAATTFSTSVTTPLLNLNGTGLSAFTGTGSVVLATSPTITTPTITTPVISTVVGGAAVGSSIELRSTSAVGTTDFIKFTVGNNGATEAARITRGLSIGTTTDPGAGAVLATASIKSNSATAGIGYATGAGGTVTQATSKSTGVTLNTATGQITTFATSLAAFTQVTFVLTNSAITANDIIVLQHTSGGTLGAYRLNASPVNGSATISIYNITGGALSEALVLSYAIIKGVTS